MKKNFLFILLLLAFTACKSEYKKVQNSTDLDYKLEKAISYYDNGEYYRSLPLLEELMSAWRGMPKAEKAYYYYAFTQFNIQNYQLASYHFKSYAESYYGTKKAMECEFMQAYCQYKDSPNFSLDQASTSKAIDAFQLFINKYPEHDKVAECNDLIDKLREKLEIKSYNTAMLFYNMEDYRAAATMLEQTLKEYPDIDDREKIEFLILQSNSEFALRSVPSKQEERLEKTLSLARTFSTRYADNKNLQDVKRIQAKCIKGLKDLKELEEREKKEEVILEIF